MRVFTLQLSKWRIARDMGVEYLDTTVKSGNPAFAPSWEIVREVKSGAMTEERYTEVYKDLMRESYRNHRSEWEELLTKDEIALCCYCPKDHFCHRHILVRMLEALCKMRGLPFEYLGELPTV